MDSDLTERSDEEVLALSISEPRVLSVLFDRYAAPFYRVALRITYNHEDAEDVVQETFLKILIHASRFEARGNGSFRGWAYEILKNTAYNSQRKEKVKNKFIGSTTGFESMHGCVDREFARIEATLDVEPIIEQIPEFYHNTLLLFYFLGLPQRKIAEQEGITPGAAKTRVFRVKKHLQRLNPDDDTLL